MTRQIDGLAGVLHLYDTFLVDQFGVLHDGIKPYPQAVDCLTRLRAAGKTVVIVSNSGKRSSINIERMNALGIDDSLYDHFVTSGDVAHQYIKEQVVNKIRRTCFLISRDNDTSAVNDLDIELTDHPTEADMIIISGSESDKIDEQHYSRLLAQAASENIMCLCTNPDKKMLTTNGINFGAGHIASIYEELGGEVVWIGKPYEAIYSHIFKLLTLASKEKALCIGDSIEHDIAGGRNNNLNTLLVRTGIVANVSDADLVDQFEQKGIAPNYMVSEFSI